MAGDWIKFEVSTSDKPEIWQIASALNIDPDAVVGKLLRIWAWFDQHTELGNAPSVTKMLLDRCVGVTGFCDQMILSGWMTEENTTINLTNFDRHNGETAKTRALTAKRVAKHKNSNAKGNAETVKSALPKEEKRREDNNIKNKSVAIKGQSLTTVDLESIGIPSQIAQDFLSHRKAKKASLTKTAMNGIAREAHRANMTLPSVLELMIQRGWTGFNADWVRESNNKTFRQIDNDDKKRESIERNSQLLSMTDDERKAWGFK